MDSHLSTAFTSELRGFVAASGTVRALTSTCYVGHPAGRSVALPEAADAALRTDLVERAIDGVIETTGACAWLTRGGEQGLTDADAGWFAAAWAGFGRHGLSLPAFVVITRTAWVDLVGGEGHTWRRVRRRRPRRPEIRVPG